MIKLLIIFLLMATTVYAKDDRTYKASPDNYDCLGEVKVFITTPITESITLDGIDRLISEKLDEIEFYHAILLNSISEIYEIKTIRNNVKAEAETIPIRQGEDI